MVNKPPFDPDQLFDSKCHCPKPVLSEDESKCLKCNGPEPDMSKIKKKRKVKKK